jgi:hypothetical protein
MNAELWAWKDAEIRHVLNSDADLPNVKAEIQRILDLDAIPTDESGSPDPS